jgi:DNA-binding beta-propeller fold protein YncE
MKTLARFSVFLAMTALCVAAEAPGFKVTKKYPVPGDGGFDYITFDGTSNRLYVSHGTEVNVLDADSGRVLGKIDDTPGVHGIAVVPKLHRGFVTNGGNATVSIFDTDTFRTIKKISVSEDPDFAFYDPQANRVLVCHGAAAVITAIDPEKEVVIGKIDLGGSGRTEGIAVNGKGTSFVNLRGESAMVATFDSQALTVKQKWPITGCKTPTGLAMDAMNSRLFIGCRSKVMAVMNSNTGQVITTLPIGEKVDGVAFDPDAKLIFASNGDGTVSVIRQKSANEYESVGDIGTQTSAKTMAFDVKFKRIFLSVAEMQPAPAGNGPNAPPRPKPGTFAVLVVERQ